jgi:hypothetical protein
MRYFSSLDSAQGDIETAEYKGMWKSGKRHGQGVLKWDDDSYFDGIWNANERVKGVLKMTNGIIYIGNFMNDKPHG